MTKNKPFYSVAKAASYNAFLTMIVGGRNIGKTYNISRWIIKKCLDNNKQFGFIRRTEDDLKKSSGSFFKALIANNEFPDYEFSVSKDSVTKQPTFLAKKKTEKKFHVIGYAFQLSLAQSFKSTNYPDIRYMFLDEFIKEKGWNMYIPDEPKVLLGLITSIIRSEEQMNDFRVFMSANAVSLMNPYFDYWKLDKLDTSIRFHFDKKRKMLVEFPKETMADINPNNPIVALTEGTAFGDYAIDNKFADSNKDFILEELKIKKFMYMIKLDGVKYAAYSARYNKHDIVYLNEDEHSEAKIYSFDFENINEGDELTRSGFKTSQLNYLAAAAANNVIYFSEISIREKFKKIMRGLML